MSARSLAKLRAIALILCLFPAIARATGPGGGGGLGAIVLQGGLRLDGYSTINHNHPVRCTIYDQQEQEVGEKNYEPPTGAPRLGPCQSYCLKMDIPACPDSCSTELLAFVRQPTLSCAPIAHDGVLLSPNPVYEPAGGAPRVRVYFVLDVNDDDPATVPTVRLRFKDSNGLIFGPPEWYTPNNIAWTGLFVPGQYFVEATAEQIVGCGGQLDYPIGETENYNMTVWIDSNPAPLTAHVTLYPVGGPVDPNTPCPPQ